MASIGEYMRKNSASSRNYCRELPMMFPTVSDAMDYIRKEGGGGSKEEIIRALLNTASISEAVDYIKILNQLKGI